jgi:hypothetical protein
VKRFLSFGLPFLVFVALLSCSPSAWGLGGDHPKGKLNAQAQWPAGLIDLINSGDRVQGHWVNQNDFFYYKGDAAALQKYLAEYAKIKDTPHTVILHLGSDQRTGPLGDEPTVRFDWKLEVIRRGWGAPLDPARKKDDPGYVVTVHIWLGDQIALSKLDVPKEVNVQSAGDLERFIEAHRMKK